MSGSALVPPSLGADSEEIGRRFRSGDYPVAVYGLGKMGLPIAATFASVTGCVTGVDIDEGRVEAINAGECPVTGEPGLPSLVSSVVGDGALHATTSGTRAATNARVHLIIVPTLLHGSGVPDLSILHEVLDAIGRGLSPGDLVLVESTVPPRTCLDIVEPTLARRSGLEASQFGVAFCPERTLSGQALADIQGTHPKIVGGTDDRATRAAQAIYRQITANEVITVSDATTAECVKVFEGVYRDVNIALANELARFTDEFGIDVTEAIDVANTQPFCDIHRPGVGVGGHCIPFYPYFLLSRFQTSAPLIRTARSVNDAMPTFAVRKFAQGLAEADVPLGAATVLLLGVTYRPGVAETRKSPAMPIAQMLASAGATVYGVDPVLDDLGEFPLQPVDLGAVETLDLDGAILITAHESFEEIDWTAFDPMVVVDGRGALDLEGSGHRVYTIGQGYDGSP